MKLVRSKMVNAVPQLKWQRYPYLRISIAECPGLQNRCFLCTLYFKMAAMHLKPYIHCRVSGSPWSHFRHEDKIERCTKKCLPKKGIGRDSYSPFLSGTPTRALFISPGLRNGSSLVSLFHQFPTTGVVVFVSLLFL